MANPTIQQHEPLRTPDGWGKSEKRFIAQLEELFDDIFRRFGRLRLEDLSPKLREQADRITATVTDIEENGVDQVHNSSVELTSTEFALSFDGKRSMTVNSEEVRIDADSLSATGHISGDVVNTQAGRSVTVRSGEPIQPLVNDLGKYLEGNVEVLLQGTHSEILTLEGFSGPGHLKITFDTNAVLSGEIKCLNCTCAVIISGTGQLSQRQRQIRDTVGDACVISDGCTYVEIQGIGMHGFYPSDVQAWPVGILATNGSHVWVKNCLIENTTDCILSQNLSIVYARDLSGGGSSNANSYAWALAHGGFGYTDGTVPRYATNFTVITHGGTLFGTEGTQTDSSGSPAQEEQLALWDASMGFVGSSETWSVMAGAHGASAGIMRAGKEAGRYYSGFWTFSDPETISATLSGKTVSDASVILTVTPSGSSSGNVTVYIAAGKNYGNFEETGVHVTIDPSLYRSVTVPLDATTISKLQSGDKNCFGVYCQQSEERVLSFDLAGISLSASYS